MGWKCVQENLFLPARWAEFVEWQRTDGDGTRSFGLDIDAFGSEKR